MKRKARKHQKTSPTKARMLRTPTYDDGQQPGDAITRGDTHVQQPNQIFHCIRNRTVPNQGRHARPQHRSPGPTAQPCWTGDRSQQSEQTPVCHGRPPEIGEGSRHPAVPRARSRIRQRRQGTQTLRPLPCSSRPAAPIPHPIPTLSSALRLARAAPPPSSSSPSSATLLRSVLPIHPTPPAAAARPRARRGSLSRREHGATTRLREALNPGIGVHHLPTSPLLAA